MTEFVKDPNFYHRHFPYTSIVGVTEKAYHFKVKDLDFWFPKSQVKSMTNDQVFAYAPFWRKSLEEAMLLREENALQDELLSDYIN